MFAHLAATALASAIYSCLAVGGLAAQAASVTYVGTDCSSYTRYVVHGLPRIGTRFVVETVPSVGSAADVFIVTGVSDQLAGGVPLPFDISQIASDWCGHLRNSAEVWTRVPGWVEPTRTYPFDVPNDIRLAGLSIYQQVARVRRGGAALSTCGL